MRLWPSRVMLHTIVLEEENSMTRLASIEKVGITWTPTLRGTQSLML